MHALTTSKPNLPAPTKLTFGIACPDRIFMVRDLQSKDAVRIAYGQHTCVEPITPMERGDWILSGLGWYLRGSDAVILDGDRLTCRHCEKTVVDVKLTQPGGWDLAQDWLLTHALDCPGSRGDKKLGCCGYV